MTRKPKKCRKCGNRDFHILTESQYRATIDGSNRHIVPSSIVTEEIKSVKCARCGKELAAENMEFDAVTLA
jgi:ribosomal protein L37E